MKPANKTEFQAASSSKYTASGDSKNNSNRARSSQRDTASRKKKEDEGTDRASSRGSGQRTELRCWHCDKTGHLRPDCRSKKKGEPPAAAAVAATEKWRI